MSKRPFEKLATYKSKKRRAPYVHNSLTKPSKPENDGLIDLSVAKLKRKESNPNSEKPKPNFHDIDKLLENEPKSEITRSSLYLLLPTSIIEGNIGAETPVLNKYSGKAFPLPKSQRAFKDRITKLLPVIPRILQGEEELSFYYTLALEQRKESPHKTMLSTESENIEWKRHVGGFFGLKRQHFVSRLIMARYGDDLRKLTNKTIVYWTPETFSTYVLANEVLLRLLVEDEGMSFAKAEHFLKDTIDYGCHVADGVEFKDDIELGDVLGGEKENRDKEENAE